MWSVLTAISPGTTTLATWTSSPSSSTLSLTTGTRCTGSPSSRANTALTQCRDFTAWGPAPARQNDCVVQGNDGRFFLSRIPPWCLRRSTRRRSWGATTAPLTRRGSSTSLASSSGTSLTSWLHKVPTAGGAVEKGFQPGSHCRSKSRLLQRFEPLKVQRPLNAKSQLR